jgi:hypothetical protein
MEVFQAIFKISGWSPHCHTAKPSSVASIGASASLGSATPSAQGRGCYAGTDGGARIAARCRILRFTIGNCGASPGTMPSKTSLRFALDATQSCIGADTGWRVRAGPGSIAGSLLLLRRVTPLSRRHVVYFCFGAYIAA